MSRGSVLISYRGWEGKVAGLTSKTTLAILVGQRKHRSVEEAHLWAELWQSLAGLNFGQALL